MSSTNKNIAVGAILFAVLAGCAAERTPADDPRAPGMGAAERPGAMPGLTRLPR